MRKKLLAGIALAFLAIFSAPVAANAADYVPSGNCTMSPSSVAPGASSTLACGPRTFDPGEKVNYSVSGCVSPKLDSVSSSDLSKPALGDGSASAEITVSPNALHNCAVVATGAVSGNVVTSTVSVLPADPAAAVVASTGNGPLADTGSNIAALLWAGGGVLIIGIVLVSLRARRRAAER